MSKALYWQRGETIDYANNTTDIIDANSIIVLGNRIGVAGTDILPSKTGSVHVTGVFQFLKESGAVTTGTDVYYSESDGVITSSSENNIKAGFAVQDAADDDTTILVKINA